MNLYYILWVDTIVKARSVPANKANWKFMTMIFVSMAMALNIALVLSVIQIYILKHKFYELNIDIFPGEKLDNALSFFILFLFPPILLNYYLIFRNNRYEMLINKYKHYDGKVFAWYFISSILIFFFYALIQ